MKNITLIMVIVALMMVISVNAEIQTLGTFKQNECIILKQTCSNCTSVNITSVAYPNSTKVITEKVMTKIGTEYNYSFCNATALGQYIVNGVGDVDGVNTVWSYDFFINQGGYDLSTAQGILYFLALLLASGMFGLTLYFSIKIPFSNTRDDEGRIVSVNKLKYLKLFLIPITYMILLLIVGITRSILADFLYLDGVSNIFNWLYWLMMATLYPIIVVAFIGIAVFLFEDNILKKKIKRRNYR